ncbi:MAG: MlaD family protein [Chlamydiota bacterium]
MTDQMKNILIGLFVTMAITIMVAMILFLEPTIGDGKKTLQVRFANVSGITVGTRVTFAGRPVGEVVHIAEVAKARDEPSEETGKVYIYQLTLKLDSSVDVYSNDEVAVRTTGLMGEKSIAILPKMASPEKPAQLVTTQVMIANSVDPLENTFNQVTKVASRLEGAVNHFDLWFNANQLHLSNALQSFHGAMTQVEAILASARAENIVPNTRTSIDLLNDNLRLVYSGLNDDQLLHKAAALAENLNLATDSFNADGADALRNINQISRDIASGSGTMGRLLVGDDFYLRLNSLLSKGDTLMNDMNHYGILFQYNKQWQKGRTRKANFLKALDTPQEFRTYFEGEIDTMTTSVGRLTELIERAGSEERSKIMESNAFKRDFAALMRHVQGLNDSLKLYNEGLIAESELELNQE